MDRCAARAERRRERDRRRHHHLHHHLHHHHHHHGPGRGCPQVPTLAPWWRMHVGLRWRLFASFGGAIAASAALIAAVYHLSGGQTRAPFAIVPLVFLWMASGAIAWRLTRPLQQVVRVARDIGDGKLESRLELRRQPGELGVLAESINDMAARIERQVRDQRELLAAVSHEIRTPLGHMRILLDGARERGGDPALCAELEREVLEIDRLVGQLLAGSRLDFEAVDRRPLAGGELAALALERAGLPVDLLDVADDDTSLEGDPTLLGRALGNLLDNAGRHGGGATRLGVSVREDAVVFEVDDRGPGFHEDDLPSVFEPFYRGRPRDEEPAGERPAERDAAARGASAGASLGLGLGLVQRIAAAHGGAARAENLPGGGARVSFSVSRR